MRETETCIVSGENWAAEGQGCPSDLEQNEFIAYPERNIPTGDVKKVKVLHSYVTISMHACGGVEQFCTEQKGKGGRKDFSLSTPVYHVRVFNMCIYYLHNNYF